MNVEEQTARCCGECGCRDIVGVEPHIEGVLADFLADSRWCKTIARSWGSPAHVVFPSAVVRNWKRFSAVFERAAVPGKVIFTTKPNKSRAIVQALAAAGAGVDVSSEGALLHALSCGVPGNRIQASGPKSPEYLALAVMHGPLVSLDSLDELRQLKAILDGAAHAPAPRLLLRISGFRSERVHFSTADTPFGVRMERTDEALRAIDDFGEGVRFLGVHFHLLGGGGRDERVVAFENALQVVRNALQVGLRPRILNVGGGFKTRIAADSAAWHRLQSYLRAALLGKVSPVTWDASGLGLRLDHGRVVGVPSYPDHVPPEVGADAFSAFLAERIPEFDDATVGALTRDMMLELLVEPGRALLDQSGLTIARVTGVKESAGGQPLVMLEMNHTSLFSREHKLLTQPRFIPMGERSRTSEGFFLFGNLCVPGDLLQYVKVYPGFRPEPGDLVVFVNTAAYQMDFTESKILHQSLGRKVVAMPGSAGFDLREDEQSLFTKALSERGSI